RKMVYPVDLKMLEAMARHDPAGRPNDPHEWHRRDLILQHRAARRQALLTIVRKAGQTLRGLASAKRSHKARIGVAKP
ncbi:MAG: hypothetical protein ACRC6I_00985, partial [Paracoccaceae bacterium]